MKFRLPFLILAIVSVHIQKGDSCTTVDDGCYSIYVCANSACSQCTTDSQCSSQHTIRTTCSSESAGDFCVQCSSDSQCGSGESCLTSSFTYLCASTCTSPTSNCGPSSQCIYIGGQFYCIPCENNIDCQGWSGNSASECITGVCSPAFLSCGQDSDCTNPASAFCWNSVCTACSSSSQCNHLIGAQICNSGTCVQCTSDSNCTDPTPYCSGSNTCVECTSDSNCAAPTPSCNLGSNTCVECTSDSNCGALTPYCTGSNTCVQCTSDSNCSAPTPLCSGSNTCVQCTSDSNCGAPTPSCNLGSNSCVQCTSDSNCAAPTPACSGNYTCVQCTSDSNCAAPTPHCNLGSNTCVQCTSDSNCAAPTPACSGNYTCIQCASDSNCAAPTPYCTGSDTCVECTTDTNCAAPTPYCSGSQTCVQCNSDSDCTVPTPRCSASNTCVECITELDCPLATAAQCSGSNTCVSCTNSTQCAHLTSTPVCKSSSGTGLCVECLSNSDCENPSKSQCSPAKNTCGISCPSNCLQCLNSGACETCLSGYYTSSINSSQNSSTQDCTPCDASCQTCNGPSSSNCLSCSSGKELSQSNTCIDQTSNFSSGTSSTQLSVTLSNTADSTQAALQVSSVGISILPIIIRGTATTAILLVNFVSDVLMYRFINVDFADNFVEFCKKLYTNYLPNIYNKYEAEYNIPSSAYGKLSVFGMSSVITGNSGNTLDREFVSLSLIFILTLLISATKKFPKLHFKLRKLRDSYKWNLFLSFYLGDFGELLLFSMIQLRENPANCWYAWYGFSLCIVFLVSYAILIGYIVYLLNRKAQAKIGGEAKTEKSTSRWKEVPESMNMICSDFKTDHWIQRNFMLIMLLESFINSMSYFLLQDYGKAQAIIYTCNTSVLFLLGAVVYRPYTSKLQNFIFGLNYSFKLMLAIIAVFIGVRQSTLSDDQLESVGLALIVVIVVAIVLNALIVVGVIISGLVQACKAGLRKKSKELPGETPSILSVRHPPLNINRLENSSYDQFYNFSSALKEIGATPVSLEKAETPNAFILGNPPAKDGRKSAFSNSASFDFDVSPSERGDLTKNSSSKLNVEILQRQIRAFKFSTIDNQA